MHGNGTTPPRERSGGSLGLSLEGPGGSGSLRPRGGSRDNRDYADDADAAAAALHDNTGLFGSPKTSKSAKGRDVNISGGVGAVAGSCSPGSLKRQASAQLDMLPTPFALSFGGSLENDAAAAAAATTTAVTVSPFGQDTAGKGPSASPAAGRSLFGASGISPAAAPPPAFGKQPTAVSFGTDRPVLSTTFTLSNSNYLLKQHLSSPTLLF